MRDIEVDKVNIDDVKKIVRGFLMEKSYDERCVGREELRTGFVISTAWTDDEGFETAVVDANGACPVERYGTKEDAVVGHKKWCEKMSKSDYPKKIIKIGGWNGLVEDETYVLDLRGDGE